MLRIEVTPEVKTKQVKDSTFRNQVCYAALAGSKYPVQIFVSLGRNQEPYPAGTYNLGPDSFRLEVEFGEPRLGFRPVLVPAPAMAKTGT